MLIKTSSSLAFWKVTHGYSPFTLLKHSKCCTFNPLFIQHLFHVQSNTNGDNQVKAQTIRIQRLAQSLLAHWTCYITMVTQWGHYNAASLTITVHVPHKPVIHFSSHHLPSKCSSPMLSWMVAPPVQHFQKKSWSCNTNRLIYPLSPKFVNANENVYVSS